MRCMRRLRLAHETPGRTALFLVVFFAGLLFLTLALHPSLVLPYVQGVARTSHSRSHHWKPPKRHSGFRHRSTSASFLPDPYVLDLSDLQNFQQYSSPQNTDYDAITAILPVTTQSLNELHPNLESLLNTHPPLLKEIVILGHPQLVSKIEYAVNKARVSLNTNILMTVLRFSQPDNQDFSVLHALSTILTSRVLVLEITALRDIDNITRMMLLDTASSAVPIGPYGFVMSSTNSSCAFPLGRTIPVAYLIPPFLSPTSLLIQAESGMRLATDTWAALGERVARISGAGFGGLGMSSKSLPQHWCTEAMSGIGRHSGSFFETFYRLLEQDNGSLDRQITPHINILFPSREHLEDFGSTACEMAQRGSVLRIMLYSWPYTETSTQFALNVGCHIHFDTIARTSPTSVLMDELRAWLHAETQDTLVIYASQTRMHTLAIETSVEPLRHAGATIVHLSTEDLPFCGWMSVLGISEWKNWQKPRIDLSVITNDRPRSLARLLSSLTAARYYGDQVQLKINLEQTADIETRQQVANFLWKSGTLHVQHRIIAAGLLPAVTEAWYPHDNDTYGVLLEDDIELSPMFYAWIKMTILRYRYGSLDARAPALFGISLYQPTSVELRVEGRVPFDPRVIFAEHGLLDPRTPYVSQVPCSWGAVYFPEHFVEFHDYLALRLSEVSHNISEVIIPDIRSNRWTKSWKKYFNELVYLRGYVMLYPNYDLALATNHAEPGTHVKSNVNHIQDSIKRQSGVPLMPLPWSTTSETRTMTSLLDLPAGSLPSWDNLPVLDLWGFVTSHKDIVNRGQERHERISGCASLRDSSPFQYDASQLLCARRPEG